MSNQYKVYLVCSVSQFSECYVAPNRRCALLTALRSSTRPSHRLRDKRAMRPLQSLESLYFTARVEDLLEICMAQTFPNRKRSFSDVTLHAARYKISHAASIFYLSSRLGSSSLDYRLDSTTLTPVSSLDSANSENKPIPRHLQSRHGGKVRVSDLN